MKKILAIIFSIIILTLCCACGTSKPTIEGDWYHSLSGHIYTFQTKPDYGRIYCDENNMTFPDGETLAGVYKLTDNYVDATINRIGRKNLYILKYQDNFVLSTHPNNTNEILFCKSIELAKKLAEEHKLKEENLRKLKQKYDTKPNFKEFFSSSTILTHDYNETNYNLITFDQEQFKIPLNWSAKVYKDRNGINLIPEKELPPIFSIQLIPVDIKIDLDDTFIREEFSNFILNLYQDEIYEDLIDNYQIYQCYFTPKQFFKLSKSVIDITGRRYLYITCTGKIKKQDYVGHIIAFYYGDKLCTINLFQYTDAKYNFAEDMESIIDTLKSTEYEKYKTSTNTSNKNISSSGSIDNLDISFAKDYIDGNIMYLKVYVKNNSSAMFKGDVHVFFYSSDGKKRLGSDMIIIDKLMPGQTSWAKVKIDKYLGTPKIETEFTNPQFFDISPVASEIDTELSKKTSNSVRLNFDVASWYKNIKSIKVMTDRTCVVTSTSSKDNSTIASAVWSCGKDYGVKTVQVVDNEGNIKAVYP